MANNLINKAAGLIDPAAERNGVWRKFSPDGVAEYGVLLRRAGTMNAAFLKRSEEATRNLRRTGKAISDMPHEEQRRITRELYAHTVVAGWNSEDFGEEFSPEACIATMEAVNDFLDWCVEEAQKQHIFYRESVKAASGN